MSPTRIILCSLPLYFLTVVCIWCEGNKQGTVKVEKVKVEDAEGNLQEGTVYHNLTDILAIASLDVEATVSDFPPDPESEDDNYAPDTFKWSVTPPNQDSDAQFLEGDDETLSSSLKFIDETGSYEVSATAGGASPPATATIIGYRFQQGPDKLWWFGTYTQGGQPITVPTYPRNATLTAAGIPPNGTFRWEVTQGTDKVDLKSGAVTENSIITVNNSNAVTLVSTAASPEATQVTYDISIELKHNGVSRGTFWTVVFTPKHLVHLSNSDQDYSVLPTPPHPDVPGFYTKITYEIQHQFGEKLGTALLAWNEDFNDDGQHVVSGVTDRGGAGDNWAWGTEAGFDVDPGDAFDEITRGDPPCSNPPAQNAGLGPDKVDHEVGSWHVGSYLIGEGVRVKQNCKWQIYRDHARHE